MKKEDGTFHIYRHIRLDKNEPFYIGKSNEKWYRRAKDKTGRNRIWKEITSKTKWTVEILMEGLTESEALKKEEEFIELYGRIDDNTGTLANLYAGANGSYKLTNSTKRILSERILGDNNPMKKGHSEKTRRQMSITHTGSKNPNGSLARTGVKHFKHKGKLEAYNLNGELIKVFDCIKDAALFFGTRNTSYITRVMRGDRPHYKETTFKYQANDK